MSFSSKAKLSSLPHHAVPLLHTSSSKQYKVEVEVPSV